MSDSSIQTGGNLGPTPTEPNVASGIASTDMPKAGTPVYVLANGQLAIASTPTPRQPRSASASCIYGVSAGQRAFYKYAGPLALDPRRGRRAPRHRNRRSRPAWSTTCRSQSGQARPRRRPGRARRRVLPVAAYVS